LGYITPKDAEKAIYIDFEGNADESPTLLGALYVDSTTNRDVFIQYVHEEVFYPAGEAKEDCINASIEEAFTSLAKIASRDDRLFFAWSSHEKATAEEFLRNRRLKKLVVERIIDCKGIARKWKNRFHRDVEFPYVTGQGRHRLSEYMKLVDYQIPKTAGPGNTGKRLRDIRAQLTNKDGDYQKLTGVAKRKWTNLLSHNRHDCLGMREVSLKAIGRLRRFGY